MDNDLRRFLNQNIGQKVAMTLKFMQSGTTCLIMLGSKVGSLSCQDCQGVTHTTEKEESCFAMTLGIQHMCLQSNIRGYFLSRRGKFLPSIPMTLPVYFVPRNETEVELFFPLCASILIQIDQIIYSIRDISEWLIVLVNSEKAPQPPALPVALRPFLRWKSAISPVAHGEIDTAEIVPQDYPGISKNVSFCASILFTARDRNQKGSVNDIHQSLLNDFENEHPSMCATAGCLEDAVFSGGMCTFHAKQYYCYRNDKKLFLPLQPKAFLCERTGAWVASCPSWMIPDVGRLRVTWCISCGVPLIIVVGAETNWQCHDCSTGKDVLMERLLCDARRAFSHVTGITYHPRDLQLPENYDRGDCIVGHLIEKVVVHLVPRCNGPEEQEQEQERKRSELLLSDVLHLLEVPLPTLPTYPFWTNHTIRYTVLGVPLSDFPGRLGQALRGEVFREFFEFYVANISQTPSVDSVRLKEFEKIRGLVQELGSAGRLAMKSATLQREFQELSALCASSGMIIGAVLDQPTPLCFEDCCLRLAQLHEVMDSVASWTRTLLGSKREAPLGQDTPDSTGPPSSGGVAVISLHDILPMGSFYGTPSGCKVDFPLTPTGASGRDLILHGVDELQWRAKLTQHNRDIALSESAYSSCELMRNLARCEDDLNFIQSLVRRTQALALAQALQHDEVYGPRSGTEPGLARLRTLLSATGHLITAGMGAKGAFACEDAVNRVLARRGSSYRQCGPKWLPPTDRTRSLHAQVIELCKRSVAYVPQDLRYDELENSSTSTGVRRPLDDGVDMVDSAWRMVESVPRRWVIVTYEQAQGLLLKDMDPEVPRYIPFIEGLVWMCMDRSVDDQQVLATRRLLLERSIDPRLFTPFGPILSRAIASFLLTSTRSIISEVDGEIKSTMAKEYRSTLTISWEENVARLNGSLLPFTLATVEHLTMSPTTTVTRKPSDSHLVLERESGHVLLCASYLSTLYGGRACRSQRASSADYRFLCATRDGCPETTRACIEVDSVNSESSSHAGIAGRVMHLAAISDVARAITGCSERKLGDIQVYGPYGASFLRKQGFRDSTLQVARHIDTNIRLQFVYERKRENVFPAVSRVVPATFLSGHRPFENAEVDVIEKELLNFNDVVHLMNFRRTARLRGFTCELLEDIWTVVSENSRGVREIGPRELLFFLESGLFSVNVGKIHSIGTVQIMIESLRSSVIDSEDWEKVDCLQGNVNVEVDTKAGAKIASFLTLIEPFLLDIEEVYERCQYL